MGFNPLDLIFGAADKVVDVLKGTGIIKDPEAEAKVRQVVSETYVREMQAATEFMKADVSEGTPGWALGFRAIVRPGITFTYHGVMMWALLMLLWGKTTVQLPSWVVTSYQAILAFWFGERLLLGVSGKKDK